MIQLIRPLRSGQITIPAPFREKLGIDRDTFLQISLIEGELRIKPVSVTTKAQDTAWFRKLYDQFSDVRKEAQKFSEKEINQVIDKAVKAVRKSHVKGHN
ncbi:AbrB/MazE/SpoVT family DNA-binding domain-containing protein [Candidatus Gottesmanbacteria bacterium]|nr:AbrB/MazE/SpoVT family DNA-binding domain-containing protein [Candidatus Gottesmanbacteria bacterium]